MKSEKTNEMKFGTDDILSPDDLDPRNVKVRVTTYLSEDVIKWLKAEATEKGIGYQTLLNDKLRDSMNEQTQVREAIDAFMSHRSAQNSIKQMVLGLVSSFKMPPRPQRKRA